MADYHTNPPNANRQYRPYGPPPSAFQRDAAYSEIFGGRPPPDRSHTMTSQTPVMPQERSRTMTSHTSEPYINYRPVHPQHARAPVHPNGHVYPNGMGPPPYGPPQPPHPANAPPRPFPGRPQYPLPQRLDPRAGHMPPPHSHPSTPGHPAVRSPLPPPALNTDPYRSRSLARGVMPPYNPPTGNYQPQAGHPPFAGPPMQMQHPQAPGFRTAQGRIVPERPGDERAMSMSAYARDQHYANTLSTGRVIPSRNVERPIMADHHPASSPLMPGGGGGGGSGGATPGPIPGHIHHTDSAPAGLDMKAQRIRRQSEGSLHSASLSMTSTVVPPEQKAMTMTMKGMPPFAAPPPPGHYSRRAPLVYPALLSRVAAVFRDKIQIGERLKNDLAYTNAFTGAEAVDLLSFIIKTSDRNLALLLGRALDAQKFFHDVTYDHRLRDTPAELYQFREILNDEPASAGVNGVFTLLTECYSPTCTRDKLCYSIACPRRLEQQARLNLKLQPGLKSSASKGSLRDHDDDSQKLWINMVPKEVSDGVDDKEKKRQEIIFEIMYTERDFVKDLEYLRDFWIRPLRAVGTSSPIPEHRREKFTRTVFGNCLEVLAVNARLAEALNARQKESHVVKQVGDIFLQFVPHFEPFIKYGANQLYGKYEFEKEKAANPAFAKFVDETERLKESRKLELNGYLTKPTTRLARYPLLLENVLKYTKEDNPDKEDIQKAIAIIRDTLSKVNAESGKSENHFNLVQLNSALKFNPMDYVDLKLTEENRVMITKTGLKKAPGESSEVTVYLFDHAVLLVRIKTVNKREEYRVYKKPIPLELLVITQMEEVTRIGLPRRPTVPQNSKEGFPVTFRHLGKGGYEQTLWATSQHQRKKFIELVESQQRKLRERNSNVCTKTVLCEKFFSANNRVNCLVPTDGGRKLLYGTDNGIYISERPPNQKAMRPRKVIDASNVTQIDIIEEYQLLLVLANKTLLSYGIAALNPGEQGTNSYRPKKVQGHANFFKTGIGLGRHLVCAAKTSTMSTTIKVYEPTEHPGKSKKKALGKVFNSGQDSFKLFKEFYINAESSSIDFLRSTLCVGCSRGFEVISLETSERQSLLDQADTSLDFVARRENAKAIHFERFNGELILNYSDFSFFVNSDGWRTRPDWKINWEGTPTAFALSYPYLLAFEPSFIEIRHIESSELVHVMTGKNIRMLHASTREILYAYEDENGEDVVASLDFWMQQHRR